MILLLQSGLYSEKRFFEMNHQEIDSILRDVSSRNLNVTDRIALFSEYFLETPYDFKCVGDGPYALMEDYPLVNFQTTNCMSLCEHVLALSISDSWDNFFNNLMKIRYKDGMIGMRTRNHYTMADWLPENDWLLESVSAQVAGEFADSMTRTISHEEFFKNKGITDLRYVKPNRTLTVPFVPLERFYEVRKHLRNGDVLALLFKNKENIFSAHMLLVIKRDDEVIIRESSNSNMSTFDTPISEWCKSASKKDRYAGIAVMRVLDKLNQPGTILLPWEIQ